MNEAPEDPTRFIRRISFVAPRIGVDVFGPYPSPEAAEAALMFWGESNMIQLESGLPFPNCTFWCDHGSTMFWIEPGQGNPDRLL